MDRPQIRDLQFVFYKEGVTVMPEIAMETSIETLDSSLGYCVRGKSAGDLIFSFEKEVFCDPHHSCLLVHLKVSAQPEVLKTLKVCLLCAPHLSGSG